MNSPFPKVIHKVLDKPMLVHVIERSMELNPSKILVVVGKYLPVIAETLSQYEIYYHILNLLNNHKHLVQEMLFNVAVLN